MGNQRDKSIRKGMILLHVAIGKVDRASAISRIMNCSIPTARKIMNELVSDGLLSKVEKPYRRNTIAYSYIKNTEIDMQEILEFINSRTKYKIDMKNMFEEWY